ncbi:MAG: PTS sugar transporter subunit IIA [Caldilineales bacterium]|nr:PTS sugar transporter subunit IIA [Caldilineales bacterium]
MDILTLDRIRLQATAADKTDAIRQAGELLVHGGCVEPPYIEGMLAREAIMSTYLGNGVAIPHGQNDDRPYILRTGVSVLQVPAGVEWEDGERAYLIIGIAATADEHVGVLANLAEVVEDEAITQQLITTDDPSLILAYLGRERTDEA